MKNVKLCLFSIFFAVCSALPAFAGGDREQMRPFYVKESRTDYAVPKVILAASLEDRISAEFRGHNSPHASPSIVGRSRSTPASPASVVTISSSSSVLAELATIGFAEGSDEEQITPEQELCNLAEQGDNFYVQRMLGRKAVDFKKNPALGKFLVEKTASIGNVECMNIFLQNHAGVTKDALSAYLTTGYTTVYEKVVSNLGDEELQQPEDHLKMYAAGLMRLLTYGEQESDEVIDITPVGADVQPRKRVFVIQERFEHAQECCARYGNPWVISKTLQKALDGELGL